MHKIKENELKGFVECYDFGTTSKHQHYLVMNRLGSSLKMMIRQKN